MLAATRWSHHAGKRHRGVLSSLEWEVLSRHKFENTTAAATVVMHWCWNDMMSPIDYEQAALTPKRKPPRTGEPQVASSHYRVLSFVGLNLTTERVSMSFRQGASGRVALAAAIQCLRAELMEAMDLGEGEKLRFDVVAPVELTLEATVTANGKGKVSWWLIEADAGVGHAATQTIKLSLDPKVMLTDDIASTGTTRLAGPDTR